MRHGELRTLRCPLVYRQVPQLRATCRMDQQTPENPKWKWQQRGSTRKLVAWSARMATGVQARSGKWKCSKTPRRFQFVKWITFRAASKSGIGKAQHLHSLPEGSELRHLLENQYNKGFLQKTHWYSRAQSGKIGVLITADHKVLSEESESRNSHRHAVVVQDLGTQWIQTYPCESKSSQETQKCLMKFLEPTRKPKSFYTDNSIEFGSLAKIFPGIIVRQHHTDRKQMGLLRQQYAEWNRYLCSIVAIRSRQWMVGGFHGMLFPSSLPSRKTAIARSVRGPKSQGPPCRTRIGRVVLSAENFGDLITADHKIVSEGCESRNNHRYAVVVQDLATQWIQA